MLTETILG